MSVRQRLVYQILVILHSSIYEGAILQTFLYLHKFERSNQPIDIHKILHNHRWTMEEI